MADVFIDCEWDERQNLIILGVFSWGQPRFQLCDEFITRNRFSRFLNSCCDRNKSKYTLLFCHGGSDIGRIMNEFNLDLKEHYYCVNTTPLLRTHTRLQDCSLEHCEQYFRLPRNHQLTYGQIWNYWASGDVRKRSLVLEHNWEDCVNLWRLVKILRSRGVTEGDLKEKAMIQR
jgi:hypothetical protein